MRLFIAIEIPEWVRQNLEQLQDPNLGVRWSAPGTIHLTLRFVGNVDDPQKKDELVQQLSSIKFPAFDVIVKGLGYFPPRKHPKVLWAGIEKNTALIELQQRVEQACVDTGFDPEDRSYTPHITIGRVKSTSKKEVNAFINQHKPFRLDPFPVDEFILFESKLDPDGARHTPLERFGLIQQQTEQEA